jgi:type II secretory pathway pseudopilin PulG
MTPQREKGFTLLEILLAGVILATCLVAIASVVASGIGSAADSINQRAAREVCRTQIEQALATGAQTGGGPVDGHDGMTWSLQRQEYTAGAIESPDQKYDIVTVTVTYPSDSAPASPGASAGQGIMKLAAITDPPDLPKPTTSTTGSTGH